MHPYHLYLSYSGREAYIICPKRYEFRYVISLEVERDPKNSLFGSTIGKVYEWFYDKNVWMGPEVETSILTLIEPALITVLEHEKFDPDTDPYFVDCLRDELNHFVPLGVKIIRDHKLLSPYSRSEVKLHITYSHPKQDLVIRLGGYADFIHQDGESIWILDGKGSKYREKYAKKEQLIWYAMLFYLRYRVAPTRLGFIFWRFPEDPVQWILYGPQDLRDCLGKTLDIAKRIQLKMFDPTPSKECYGCDYKDHCDDGKKYIAARHVESRVTSENSIFDMEMIS